MPFRMRSRPLATGVGWTCPAARSFATGTCSSRIRSTATFTDGFLNQRRGLGTARVDRDAILRWLRAEYPNRWSEATLVQFGSKLLSAALEAGLVSKRDPRTLHFPKVSDLALAYLLYLLRETRFEGTLTANPYLRSVGLDEDLLLSRARTLPGLRIRSMMHLTEIDWDYRHLGAWARGVLA